MASWEQFQEMVRVADSYFENSEYENAELMYRGCVSMAKKYGNDETVIMVQDKLIDALECQLQGEGYTL